MSIEVATGDLLRALALVNAKEDEPVQLAFPPGLAELTIHRGWWETVVWRVESDVEGPAATVVAGQLRAAADRPMITTIDDLDDGGLRVGDAELGSSGPSVARPSPSSMLGGTDLNLPLATTNPYAPTLGDIDQGGAKVWLPFPLMQRFRQRRISRARLFPDLGLWYVSGLSLEDTHVVRVSGRVAVY